MSSRAAAWALLAAACGSGGLFLGWHHPVAPTLCVAGFVALVLAHARWPGLWLVLVPACLPWLNFSPWTGWLLVDEFDLLLLAAFAGSYSRIALARPEPVPGPGLPRDTALVWLAAAIALSGAIGLVRGLWGEGPVQLDWFAGYTDRLNSVRVTKSLVGGLLLLPLIRRAIAHDRVHAASRLLLGMSAGLACVAVAALWERLAYPGLADFSAVYRVTALFWEMHVGGGAIDGYLAMASPFAVLLLLRARGWLARGVALVLLTGVAYACLATFSRGVYVGVIVPLVLVSIFGVVGRTGSRRATPTVVHAASPAEGRVPRIYWALLAVPAVLLWWATGPGSFLSNRLTHTDKVWGWRMQHWHNSVQLLQTPADWMFGIGAGRFPARYSEGVAGAGFAGEASYVEPDDGTQAQAPHVRLRGPHWGEEKGGLFALTQRVDLMPGARYQIGLDVRPLVPSVVVVQVCERHLLYDWNCQGAAHELRPSDAPWQRQVVPLQGDAFATQPWFAPRLGMLSVSVVSEGGAVDMRNLHLQAGDGPELVTNGNFAQGMARWFPAAQYYFLPWHPDSGLLDLLVERGLWGLMSGAGLLVLAVARCLRYAGPDLLPVLCLLAGLLGAMLVGVVSSFADVPRVATLMYLLSYFAMGLGRSNAALRRRATQT